MAAPEAEKRKCPGERYEISPAICRTRQRNQYPKCLLCPHRDPELAGSVPSDSRVSTSIFHRTAVLGRVPEQINAYVMRKVGLAGAQFLRSEDPDARRLAVACDRRDHSRGFCRAFAEGVNRGGMDVLNLGPVPPDVLAFVLGTDGCAGGAFVGGGNYADNVNGVRLWQADCRLVGYGAGLEKVSLMARRMRLGRSRMPGNMQSVDPMKEYVPYARKFAPNLRRLKVVVHAGSGTAGRVLEQVAEELLLELVCSGVEEDPHAPNLGKRFPSSDIVSQVGAGVRESRADCGAAIDFDGERIAFLDDRGGLLRHDVAAAFVAAEMLARTPGGRIAFDLRSSAALRASIQRAGGQPVSAPADRLGFVQHLRRNDALYGADATGLHYFRDFFRFASPLVALLTFCCHLSRQRRPVSEMADELDRFRRSGEITISLPSGDAAEGVLNRVREEFPNAEKEMIDGLTVRTQDWWFNLRQPGKAAELRLNVEGRTNQDVRRGRQTVEGLVRAAVEEA